MACSLTVEALLHPWSGRIDKVSGLPTLKPDNITIQPESYALIDANTVPDVPPDPCPDNDPDILKITTHHNHSLNGVAITKATKTGENDSTGAPNAVEVTRAELKDDESVVSFVPHEGYTTSSVRVMANASSSSHLSQLSPIDISRGGHKDDEAEETHCSNGCVEQEETDDAAKVSPAPPLVRKLSPSPMFHNEFFKVSRSSIAGWGAFAVKDLHFGETILREVPLFVAESSNIFREFEKLDAKARHVALGLHAHELLKSGIPRLRAVWNTNCFSIGHQKAGLFPIAARFNHACHPAHNIDYKFNRELGCLTLTVRVGKIAAGEELRISYGNYTPSILYLGYGFRCRCGACEGLSDEEVSSFAEQW